MEQIILIARHGSREDSADPDWQQTAGEPYDPDLSPDGVIQAMELAQRIAGENIHHLFASPYLRTIHTAHYCALRTGLEINLEDGLGEWLNPEWFPHKPVLKLIKERARQFPLINTGYRSRVIPRYPESKESMNRRCRRTINRILNNFKENIMLVGHGAPCMAIVQSLIHSRLDAEMPLCSLIKIIGNRGKWELIKYAGTSHLISGTG